MKTTLLAAASALVLSTGAVVAAPAVTETPLNLHAGPSARSPVIGTVPAGSTVDIQSCVRSWCGVRFAGERGFAPRRHLALAGGPAVVAAAPGYVYEDGPYYGYGDYDDGYAYGPSVGFYAGTGYGYRNGWRGNHRWDGGRVGAWQGNRTWSGNRTSTWQGGRTGTWQGRPGAPTGGARIGSAGISRGGGMAPGSVSPQVSAPAGMGAGASVGGGAAVSTPPASGAAGGGAVVRGQTR